MTTSGYDHSLTVIKPEGYQLVVETVDRYGIRNGTSRVRLKSEEVIASGDGWHLNKSGEAHIVGEPDSLQVDAERVSQNFINDAYIQGCAIYNVKIGTVIVSGQLAGKSDDRLMKVADEHDPVSLKTTAYKFHGEPLPFGGFPGPNGNIVGDGIRQALMARAGYEDVVRDNVYNGMTLREYARMSLTERGIGVASYNPMQMVGFALTHSTSDFGNILLDVANKALLQGWEEAEETFELWTKKGSLSDFKTAHRVGMGGFPSLRQVRETACYHPG